MSGDNDSLVALFSDDDEAENHNQLQANTSIDELNIINDTNDGTGIVRRNNNQSINHSGTIRVIPKLGNPSNIKNNNLLAHKTKSTSVSSNKPSCDIIDDYSKFHLHTRVIGTIELSTQLSSYKIYNINKLPTNITTAIQHNLIHNIDSSNKLQQWCIYGVLSHKSDIRDSSNHKKYMICRINNMYGYEVSIFIFGDAFPHINKLDPGALLYILQPSILQPNDTYNSAQSNQPGVALSINTSKQIIYGGQTIEFGYCKSYTNETNSYGGKTKSMKKCKNIINTMKGDYCDYHIKSEYNKIKGQRGGINTSASTNIQYSQQSINNISGKQSTYDINGTSLSSDTSQRIYGSSMMKADSKMMAVLKHTAKHSQLLQRISTAAQSAEAKLKPNTTINNLLNVTNKLSKSQPTTNTTINQHSAIQSNKQLCTQCKHDNQLHNKFCVNCGCKLSTTTISVNTSTGTVLNKPSVQLMAYKQIPQSRQQINESLPKPMLGRDMSHGNVALQSHDDRVRAAHIKAAKHKLSQLQMPDPNNTNRISNERVNESVNKIVKSNIRTPKLILNDQPIAALQYDDNTHNIAKSHAQITEFITDDDTVVMNKKRKLDSTFKNDIDIEKIKQVKSIHANNIIEDTSHRDGVFDQLHKKEQMLDSMANIRSQTIKAYLCTICHTTTDQPPVLCQTKQHTIQRVNATKKWYDCISCSYKTHTITGKLPSVTCGKCGGSKWQSAGMITQTLLASDRDQLQHRGEAVPFSLRGDYGQSTGNNKLIELSE